MRPGIFLLKVDKVSKNTILELEIRILIKTNIFKDKYMAEEESKYTYHFLVNKYQFLLSLEPRNKLIGYDMKTSIKLLEN